MPNFQDLKTSAQSGNGFASGTSLADAKTSEQALGRINRDLQEKATEQRATDLKLPYVNLAIFPINPDVLHLLPEESARTSMAMPFFKSGKNVKFAVSDPENEETKKTIQKLEDEGFIVQLNIASPSSIEEAFKLYASDQYKLKKEITNVVKEEEIHYEKELLNLAKVKDTLATLPSEEGLNLLNVSAIRAGASDIHYQPEEKSCTIRFRIDGVLHTVFEIGKDTYEQLANQLKYKAGMKLNIISVPQDGRFRFIVNDRRIDVRVASLPTEYGESFVCRILDTGKKFDSFEELGFAGKTLEVLKKASELSEGMVLVTGPTSSGKTTTLYVLLTKYNQPEIKIITLEDPIEYHLKGLTQSQINEKKGYTFANGLRSILRQDPDVVMVGEIRDLDTAQVSAQAALTGHVLLSTLHTNSAVDTIPRLLTIGVPAFMIAPALSVVIAQRLVRRLCTACADEKEITAEEKVFFEKKLQEITEVDPSCDVKIPAKLKTAKGCEACNFTHYRGQMVVSEMFSVNDEIKEAILKNKSTAEIFAIARKNGMLTMTEDAYLKVLQGHTALEEVQRVVST